MKPKNHPRADLSPFADSGDELAAETQSSYSALAARLRAKRLADAGIPHPGSAFPGGARERDPLVGGNGVGEESGGVILATLADDPLEPRSQAPPGSALRAPPALPPLPLVGLTEYGRRLVPLAAPSTPEPGTATLQALLTQRRNLAHGFPLLLRSVGRACEILATAHTGGVVHGAVCPENILVRNDWQVELRSWRSGAATPPTIDEAMHMSPEQARGKPADERSDVFGIGAVLCTLLTGQPPFVGASADQLRRRAARGDIDDTLKRLAHCGTQPELVSLAKRCLAARLGQRPASAGEVAAALEPMVRRGGELWPPRPGKLAAAQLGLRPPARARRGSVGTWLVPLLWVVGGAVFAVALVSLSEFLRHPETRRSVSDVRCSAAVEHAWGDVGRDDEP
jgi:hypothetical protein